MKRLTALFLALLLLASLPACKKDDKGDAPEGGAPIQGVEPSRPTQPPDGTDGATGADAPAPDEPPDETPEGPSSGKPDEADKEETPEAEISLSHSDVTLFSAGETFTLTGSGVEGVYAATYTSADPAVAEVDGQTGVVTAVAPGITTVSVHIECGEGQFDLECIVRCRWTEDAADPPAPGEAPVSVTPSLADFFATLQGGYEGLGAMMTLDGELLENYYPGLLEIPTVEEVLIQETMISISNVAVGLVRLSDGASLDDVLAVQEILQARITAQADGGAWYPESCETWKQGVIASASHYVGMFVYPDSAQDMADLFTLTFGN